MIPNKLSLKLGAIVMSVAGALAPSLAYADVVVQGNTPQQAPAAPVQQAPAPVVVQPNSTNVEAAPAPSRRTTVVEHEQRNYMSTIFVSALMGGLAGALIGGAIYFLADDQQHAPRIAYWAAGGVLVGTGVGLTQVLVQESRVDRAVAFKDPAPTFRLALFTKTF